MRDTTLREAKATLRGFFAGQDTAYLTRVVDKCRSGEFAYSSTCNCILGLTESGYWGRHSSEAYRAESALSVVGNFQKDRAAIECVADKWTNNPALAPWDRIARNRTLPLVLAEIKRRNKQPARQPEAGERLEVKA